MFPAAWIPNREKKGSNLALKGQRARWYKWNKLKDVPDAETLAKDRWEKVCKIRSKAVVSKLNSITHGKLVRFETPEATAEAGEAKHSKLLTQVLVSYNGNKRGLSNTHQHMGVNSDKGLCLSPEETLYLMMIGHFRALSTRGIQISGQHFLVMASMYHQFRTYVKLARSSIRLVNHQPHIAVTSYEKSIKLHQHSATDTKRKKKLQTSIRNVSNSGSGCAFESHTTEQSASELTIDDELAAFYSTISKDLTTNSNEAKLEDEEEREEMHSKVDDKEYDMKKREILTDLNSMDPCTGIYYLSASKNYLPKSIKVLDRDYIISEKNILDSYRFKARFAVKGELRHEVLDSDIEASSSSDSESVASLSDYDSPSDSEDACHPGWYGNWNNKVYMKRVMIDVEEQRRGVKRDFGDEEESDFKPPDKIFKNDVDLRIGHIEQNPSLFGIHNSNGNGDTNGGFTSQCENLQCPIYRADVDERIDTHVEEVQVMDRDNVVHARDITEDCVKFIADMRNKTDSMTTISDSTKSVEETQPSDLKYQANTFLDKLKEEWQDVDKSKEIIPVNGNHVTLSKTIHKNFNEFSTSKECNLARNTRKNSDSNLDRMISSGPKGSLTVSFSVGKVNDSNENPSVYSRLDGNNGGDFSQMEDDDLRNFLKNSSRSNTKFRVNGRINNINLQSNHRRNQFVSSGFLNGHCHEPQINCGMEVRIKNDKTNENSREGRLYLQPASILKHHSSNGIRAFSNGTRIVNAGGNNGTRNVIAGGNNGTRDFIAGGNNITRVVNAGGNNITRVGNNGTRATNAGGTINNVCPSTKKNKTSEKNKGIEKNKGSVNQQARRLKFAEDKKYKSGESVMHLDIAYQAQSWGEYKRLLERRRAKAAKRVSNDILYNGVNTPTVTGGAVSVGSLFGGSGASDMLIQWVKNGTQATVPSSKPLDSSQATPKHFIGPQISSERKPEEGKEESWLLPSVSYDLYPHNSGFAKSNPTIPHSRILVPSHKEFDVCNHLLLRSHFADSARLSVATNSEHHTGRIKFQSLLPTEGETFTAKDTVWCQRRRK